MSSDSQISTAGSPTRAEHFATTHWSVVLTAGQDEGQKSEAALEKLCRTYWYPLYAFARRLGQPPQDAQDLTQAFFAHLLESNLVGKANPEKGKFRSFLLASIKNFMASERDRAHAQKRGGGRPILSLDEANAEGRFALEPQDESAPDTLFERTWAIAVLEQAIILLETEYRQSGKESVFKELKVFLLGEKVSTRYADVAAKLGMTEGAVKMLVQRMRQRYRECLRAVVADTVGTPAEIADELGHLVRVLSG